MAYGRYMKAYKKTDLEAEISVADPHRLTQMMFEGLIDRLAQAKGAIERKDFEAKAEKISKAVGIINGLQATIKKEHNPEIADRLYDLYEHMKYKLVDASTNLSIQAIDEVIALVQPIKEAWDNIPNDIKEKINAQILEEQKLDVKK